MNELREYVDCMFVHYKQTTEIKDLKEEIYSNLEARKADLICAGVREEEAVQKAKCSITEVDSLIDSNKNIYVNQFKQERLQWGLIYLLAAWVITIPLSVFHEVAMLSMILFLISAGVGIYYTDFIVKNKKRSQDETEFVNMARYVKFKKVFWILWTAFVLLCSLLTTAVYFGSNIWFSRPISIDGPYAFGVLIINYFAPLLTIVLPLIVSLNSRLVLKYEVSKDENEE